MNISGHKLISCSADYILIPDTYFQSVLCRLLTTVRPHTSNSMNIYMDIKCVRAAVRDGLAELVRYEAGDRKITFRHGGGSFVSLSAAPCSL